MKRKILIILLLLILTTLTGCSATFDVNISSVSVDEDITISAPTEELDVTLYNTIRNDLLNEAYNAEILEYYSYPNGKDDNPLNAGISYNMDDYTWDTALSRCYDTQEINNKDNILTILTSNYFSCFDKYSKLDSITINVTSNYKVISNNADSVKNDVYTWIINKNNNKGINLSVDLNNKNKSDTQESFKNFYQVLLVIFPILVIILFIYVYLKSQSKKANKI